MLCSASVADQNRQTNSSLNARIGLADRDRINDKVEASGRRDYGEVFEQPTGSHRRASETALAVVPGSRQEEGRV